MILPAVDKASDERMAWRMNQEITVMRRRNLVVTAGTLTLCVLTGLALVGCVSSRSDVKYGPKGPVVKSSTLRQIKVGETNKEWLLAVLGEPTRESQLSDGTELMTYEYTKKTDSDLDVFIFFDTNDRREERTVYVFELRDGVVTKYWKE
ncbi:MAG: hypothetical protein A2Y77_09320 [Planctomycetes bacterium RBG_13_62_9]|nr:MAG: hypothetical protein A2Y77_09320 [Planctomycetes bacterium RBG_13_62_9]